MLDYLIPIFICVVLPISIVLIISIVSINRENKRTKIIIKAIESNNDIDANKLAEKLSNPRKTTREIIYQRLLRGCIFSFIGICCLIIAGIIFCSNEFDFDSVTLFMLLGGVFISIGASYLIVYFVSRKQVPTEHHE